MTDTEKKLADLLRVALIALNTIPNARINHPDYPTTYKLASAIDSALGEIDK